MGNLWNREPVLFMAVLQSGLALLLAFGVHLSVAQVGSIMAFASALLGVIVRSQVTSPATTAGLNAAKRGDTVGV